MNSHIKQIFPNTHELQKAHGLIIDISKWLQEKGMKQWETPISWEAFEAAAIRGEVFGLFLGDELAGSVTLTKMKDSYWGETVGPALYLHRLVVSRAFKGQDLGDKLIKWAQSYTHEEGYEYLRLDCRDSNPILKEYYKSKGFTFKGLGEGLHSYALFEKKLATETNF